MKPSCLEFCVCWKVLSYALIILDMYQDGWISYFSYFSFCDWCLSSKLPNLLYKDVYAIAVLLLLM